MLFRPPRSRTLWQSAAVAVLAAGVALIGHRLVIHYLAPRAPDLAGFEFSSPACPGRLFWVIASVGTWMILMRPLRNAPPGTTLLVGLGSPVLGAALWLTLGGLCEAVTGREGALANLSAVPVAAWLGVLLTSPVSLPIGVITAFIVRFVLRRPG